MQTVWHLMQVNRDFNAVVDTEDTWRGLTEADGATRKPRNGSWKATFFREYLKKCRGCFRQFPAHRPCRLYPFSFKHLAKIRICEGCRDNDSAFQLITLEEASAMGGSWRELRALPRTTHHSHRWLFSRDDFEEALNARKERTAAAFRGLAAVFDRAKGALEEAWANVESIQKLYPAARLRQIKATLETQSASASVLELRRFMAACRNFTGLASRIEAVFVDTKARELAIARMSLKLDGIRAPAATHGWHRPGADIVYNLICHEQLPFGAFINLINSMQVVDAQVDAYMLRAQSIEDPGERDCPH
jgi:hypothetical protein